MGALSRPGKIGPAVTGRAAPKDRRCWAISTGRVCVTMRLRILGIQRIRRADQTAAAAKPICAAPGAMACSIASRLNSFELLIGRTSSKLRLGLLAAFAFQFGLTSSGLPPRCYTCAAPKQRGPKRRPVRRTVSLLTRTAAGRKNSDARRQLNTVCRYSRRSPNSPSNGNAKNTHRVRAWLRHRARLRRHAHGDRQHR
jgi:hypothetical protein